MNKCRQTKVSRGFSLIVDDSSHRKSGNFTAAVGRQYVGEIGKIENGVVVVTSHLYDGVKSLPLDLEIYQHANSLDGGKKDPEFVKKPDLAMSLIERSLERGYRPGIVLIDAGYGNNKSFLSKLKERRLKYIGGLAKNRKVQVIKGEETKEEIRVSELAQGLSEENFEEIQINLNKTKRVWVATIEVKISQQEGNKTIAIVMNAPTFAEATDIDYLITNVSSSKATAQWFVETYAQRNWIEVFYREAKGWLGLREYQVRDIVSLKRHFVLVFCAYTFILWHSLTGGLIPNPVAKAHL